MYHLHFGGAHHEIGYRFGASLAQRGQFLLDQVPFPVTQERIAFAQACVPIYQKFFPELLEEIQGAALGQRCDPSMLQAVLFSMYAIPPACGCSCFSISDGEHILLGRNSDFLTSLEKWNTNVIYRFSSPSHSFTGNTTAFMEMEDGVNECGLAVGMTAVYPAAVSPGLNAGMLLRFFLEKCRDTEEVLRHIQRLPIGSAQTITVADTGGSVALIECDSQRTAVLRPSPERPFVCAANHFVSPEMSAGQSLHRDAWQSGPRYETLVQTLERSGGKLDVPMAQDLLAGKNGFLCQYDRKTGQDTVWSVLYDLKGKAIYRTEGNPNRRNFKKDERFSLG